MLCCAVPCRAVLGCDVYTLMFTNGTRKGLLAPCCAVLCCAVLCCAVLCRAALCCAVLCCAVLCCAVLCRAVLCHVVCTVVPTSGMHNGLLALSPGIYIDTNQQLSLLTLIETAAAPAGQVAVHVMLV